jgi:hypothetical protein
METFIDNPSEKTQLSLEAKQTTVFKMPLLHTITKIIPINDK